MPRQPVSGFFIQDDLTLTDKVPTIAPHFGLKNTSPTRWSEFREKIKALNEEAKKEGASVKFFLLSRHGQGYHNIVKDKYGVEAWRDYWAKLNGDGEIVWGPDPQLTPIGISQAEDIHRVLLQESKEGLGKPDKRYCSPLSRAIDTCSTMYDGVYDDLGPALIMENCREENGVHTCDKRKTRSYIAATFPSFEIEPTLTEQDELWDAEVREPKAQLIERTKKVLDWVFENDRDDLFISITTHAGWIRAVTAAVGRESIHLPTGGVLPIVVKGMWVANGN
ncbi:histidine phosphatase superfamily [Panaeolus papilionaceus]|nr:histidine phosphatase superfamily [Panaeolus papilionaceus]